MENVRFRSLASHSLRTRFGSLDFQFLQTPRGNLFETVDSHFFATVSWETFVLEVWILNFLQRPSGKDSF